MVNFQSNYRKGLIIFLLLTKMCHSQTFFPLDSGFEQNCNLRAIYYDTLSNRLFTGGTCVTTANGLIVNGIAQWDGQNWDSLSIGLDGFCFAITKYGNDIVVGGVYNHAGGVATKGLAKWNGSSFSHFADFEYVGDGCVQSLYKDGADLYVGGCYDILNGSPANGMAKYDGNSWSVYPTLRTPYPFINGIIKFNNDLFVGGLIDVPNSSPPIYALAKWNGSQWQKVGSGFPDINAGINKMAIYQNELYVVGAFTTATGCPGNNIAKWNGTLWSQCGSGLVTAEAEDLVVYQNELYVVGLLQSAGGIPVSVIAKWDGNQWHSVPGGNLCYACTGRCLHVANGDLYLGGTFDTINGLPFNHIAKYNYPVGIKNSYYHNLPVTIYPTLAHASIKFSYNTIVQSTGDVKIYNSTGQTVYKACNINLNQAEFDVSHLPAGVYHLRAYAKDGEGGARFVKE